MYHVEHGASPTLNFGGLPGGYRGSSGNNANLVARGRRFRGGRGDSLPPQPPSIPPVGPLSGDPRAGTWCGHQWTPWVSVRDVPSNAGVGLYRVGWGDVPELAYVGQGRIANRLRAHLAKAFSEGHRQADAFAHPMLEASWVPCDLPSSQLQELENDLIAAHVVERGVPPRAQFLDSPRRRVV
jgi:hypothetical protein